MIKTKDDNNSYNTNNEPGRNYISFPATSSDNFDTIFTNSGIKDNISKFFTYDPILGYTDEKLGYTDVSYFDYIDNLILHEAINYGKRRFW